MRVAWLKSRVLIGEPEFCGPAFRCGEASADLGGLAPLAARDLAGVGEIGVEQEGQRHGGLGQRPVGHANIEAPAAADEGADLNLDALGDNLAAAVRIAGRSRLVAGRRGMEEVADGRVRLDIEAADRLQRVSGRSDVEARQKSRLVEEIAVGLRFDPALTIERHDMKPAMRSDLLGIEPQAASDGECHGRAETVADTAKFRTPVAFVRAGGGGRARR